MLPALQEGTVVTLRWGNHNAVNSCLPAPIVGKYDACPWIKDLPFLHRTLVDMALFISFKMSAPFVCEILHMPYASLSFCLTDSGAEKDVAAAKKRGSGEWDFCWVLTVQIQAALKAAATL